MTSSPVQQVTHGCSRRVLGYAGVASAARLGDAGSGVGVLLLTIDREGDGRGAVVGGLLTAALTAPHVLGPWTGRLLDRVGDPRRVLAAACVLFGLALAAGSFLLQARQPGWACAAFVLAGAAGPMLTGGFSSVVASLPGDVARARSVDALTYGVAGTAGPALVAGVGAATTPLTGVLTLAATVTLSAIAVGRLPPRRQPASRPTEGGAVQVRTARAGRWVLLRSRPLRQVTLTTVAVAAGGGVLTVAAVLLAAELGGGAQGRGGWFITALGVGNLLGSAVLLRTPLRGEPVRQSLVLALGLAVATAAVAGTWNLASGVAAFAFVGALTAPWVTATLNARQLHAPPGRTGSVFVALAGVKIAGASAGAALAGLASGLGPRPLVLAAAAVVTVSVLGSGLGPPGSAEGRRRRGRESRQAPGTPGPASGWS